MVGRRIDTTLVKQRPLGCLTGTSLIVGLVVALGVTIAAAASGNAIFSPGPLNAVAGGEALGGVTSHVELGRECGSCHAPFWSAERMEDRCLACHAQVRRQMEGSAMLHGSLPEEFTCRDCHIDHEGPDAELTRFDLVDYPHESVGFSLQAHQSLPGTSIAACENCHQESVNRFRVDTCRRCHLEIERAFLLEHMNTFSPACLNCHDGVDSYGAAFDHQRQDFSLQGRHKLAACGDCHDDANTLEVLRATPQQCADCHLKDDAHEQRLGIGCESCHSPLGWPVATIDHDLTRFPLIGAHAETGCRDCHADGQMMQLGTTCSDCHADDDAHAAAFGANCDACHAPTRWQDVSFDHNLLAFPLTGAHGRVACQACRQAGIFQGLSSACASCHADPAFHRGLFGVDCASCHSTTA